MNGLKYLDEFQPGHLQDTNYITKTLMGAEVPRGKRLLTYDTAWSFI